MNTPFHLKPHEHLGDPTQKRALNRLLFETVAPHYDTITRWLSFGRDRTWKYRLITALPPFTAPNCLDLACGTGDLAFGLAARFPNGRVLGLDLTPAMIERARARCRNSRIRFEIGDLGCTGLPDTSFDIVTGGYALRNAGDLDEALAEVFRLLKPGGVAAFLDFSKPPDRTAQKIELRLLRFWGGLWGLALHRNPDVYGYIADSLEHYPHREELAHRFTATGFKIVKCHRYFFGFVESVQLRKPEPRRAE